MSGFIFDTHSHYDDSRFDDCRTSLLSSLKAENVSGIVTCGCDRESSLAALKIADEFDFVYAAVGIHPGNLSSGDGVCDIKPLCSHKKCVAIGEIGLDYYWEKNKRDQQIKIFTEQIKLAKSKDLPIIVHDREAHQDTLDILLSHKPKGVVHCFSGSADTAKQLLNIGMYIGIGGVITFKNARKLPEVVEIIPDDKLLLETDCPYLAPEPFRGKLCHSGMIIHTAKRIADIRKTSVEHILHITELNAKRLFGI